MSATTLAAHADLPDSTRRSGDWLYEIGLPGKSGIGGGIVTVSPGKGGLGMFAPPLDEAQATASRGNWPRSSCRSASASTLLVSAIRN